MWRNAKILVKIGLDADFLGKVKDVRHLERLEDGSESDVDVVRGHVLRLEYVGPGLRTAYMEG